MKPMLLIAAMVAIGGIASGDLIRFQDDIELGGDDVQVLSCNDEHVKVKVVYGTVTLNASRIKTIKINFRKRIESLAADGKDTARNLFDLGVLCDQNHMTKEANEAYAMALRKQDIPADTLRRLAAIFEERHLWPEAKAAYDRMLLTNPADAFLQKKVDFCEQMAGDAPAIDIKLHQPEPDNTEPVKVVDDPEPQEPPEPGPDAPNVEPQPEAQPKLVDGYESNTRWTIEQWGNAATCESVVQDGGGDNRILSIAWTQKDKDKVALRLNVDLDLTDKTKLTFDACNMAEKPLSIGIAFNTLPGYQFFESIAINAPTGKWVPVEINLADERFKCAATNWRHKAAIANKDNVKDIFIMIYNRDPSGVLYLDNIRFHTAEAAN